MGGDRHESKENGISDFVLGEELMNKLKVVVKPRVRFHVEFNFIRLWQYISPFHAVVMLENLVNRINEDYQRYFKVSTQ